MLQRAASNAYSWWWASHIRTKQSKWLEQSLQDMEEKVASVLKLIEEDGDSFRKRAEMYYKKRPELISFVEESYRAFRALAERYDHISKELQNANHTIATVFPDQVPFEMDDDDDDGGGSPRTRKKPSENSKLNIPKIPKAPIDDIKGMISTATKKLKQKKTAKKVVERRVVKSGLSKHEGLGEIDKLQKRILALQTEKEFVKSSYEGGVAKYWEIEQEIGELQDKVYNLQDEFGPGNVIEDDEARNVMATAALKSCQEALTQLQEKQEKITEEAKVEQKRVKDTRKKLNTLKDGFCADKAGLEKPPAESKPPKTEKKLKISEQEAEGPAEARADVESSKEKKEEHFNAEYNRSLTVAQMAEKIDELVNKVVSLESAASSQTALIHTLRTETDELQVQIQTLEDDKNALVDGKNDLSNKLREMEERCKELQDLNQRIEDQKNDIRAHFTETSCNIGHLSEKLPAVKPDEESEFPLKSEEKLETTTSSGVQSSSPEKKHSEEDASSVDADPEKLHIVNSEENLQIMGSPKEKTSLAETKSLDGVEEQEQAFDGKDLQNDAPEDELKVSDSPRKKEKSLIQLGPIRGPQQQGEAIVLDGGSKMTKSVEEEGSSEAPEKELKVSYSPRKKAKSLIQLGPIRGPQKQEDTINLDDGSKMTKIVEEEGSADSKHDLVGDNQASSQMTPIPCNVESQEKLVAGDGEEPDWKHICVNGMDGKEKNILLEYTNVLRNYKQMKKTLAEVEAKNQNYMFEVTLQLRDLKNANALKDEEIRILQQKLNLLQTLDSKLKTNSMDDESAEPRFASNERIMTEDREDDIRYILVSQSYTMSPIEEKFRMEIDEVLEGNLNFWLRFSTTISEIQKFETEVKDLQAEASKLEGRKKQDGSSTTKYSLKSDVRPTYKYLKEVQTELAVWLEKSLLLKKEVKSRFSSLCEMQEEITKALKQSAEDDDFTFTSYQAAKFQGEILNMKQENNKVADELQAGLDHVATLHLEVERTLAKLSHEFGLDGSKSSQPQLQHSESRSRVPLRSFIFDAKPKKPRSILSVVHPALYRKNHPFRLVLNR